MKNFVSFNIKAKKKCDADAMILHQVNLKARHKSDNVTLKHFTKHNVSSSNIHNLYKKETAEIEKNKGKAIQKNANHYLEGVLSFSYEQVCEYGIVNFKKDAPALIELYGKDIAKEFGFEFLGFSLHFDEAQIKYQIDENGDEILDENGEKVPLLDEKGQTIVERDENGKPKINFHAHIDFINFDKKTNKARFREIQRKFVSERKFPNLAFKKMQDMAGQMFQKLGFERGLSKEITGHKHVEKAHMELEKELRERERQALERERQALARAEEAEERVKNAEIELQKADDKLTIMAEREIALNERFNALKEDFAAYQANAMQWAIEVVKKSFKKAAVLADGVAYYLNNSEIIKNDNLTDEVKTNITYDFKKIEDENNVTDEAKITNKVKFKL